MKNAMQMKTNVKCLFIIAMLSANLSNQSQAQPIESEEAFFVFMKVYDLTPSTPSYVSKRGASLKDQGENFLVYYLNVFDPYNFQQKRNDEFERNKYAEKMYAKIVKGINNVRFEKKYTISGRADFGEYSSANNSFPIKFDPHAAFALPFYQKNFLESFCEILNFAHFKMELKMSEAQARTLIAKRKNPNGTIDRSISLNLTYSVVNKKTTPADVAQNFIGSNIVVYVYSIDILDHEGATKKLGTLYPDVDYYDKVNAIKLRDGTDTIYYKSINSGGGKRRTLFCSREEAQWYRILDYADGKIAGKVKDYYLSGQLFMEGTYGEYSAEDGDGNGLFTWYFENGQKSKEINYVFGKQHGTYTSWYKNGVKKEEVNMVEGKKDGCYYQWKESGKPDVGLRGYFDFYENGKLVSGSRQCPSDSRKQ